jgi:enamine deaminase RidA (YjgF/YER057c/UK114 family)
VTLYQQRFQELGMPWPQVIRPDLPFSPAVRVGEMVYVSGQIPEVGPDIAFTGRVGHDIDLETAKKAAELCAANVIYWLHRELDGDLDRVVRFAKVNVYVNAVPGFSDYSLVGNGASELLLKIFGTRGEHARAALGMGGLPVNVPVEVDAVVQVR